MKANQEGELRLVSGLDSYPRGVVDERYVERAFAPLYVWLFSGLFSRPTGLRMR